MGLPCARSTRSAQYFFSSGAEERLLEREEKRVYMRERCFLHTI